MIDLFDYPFLVRGFLCVMLLAPLLGGISHLVVARRMAFLQRRARAGGHYGRLRRTAAG
jgi:ABC-type Mn2+/Zn2+ transport system permease subunit